MATTFTPNLILKEALAAFHQGMETAEPIWKNHCMLTESTTNKETYAFAGMIPTPTVFRDARSIQGFRDFKFDLTNNTYELTILVKRNDFADDQTGTVVRRFQELAEVFSTYKDEVFAALLENGHTDNAPFDDDLFFDTDRTLGDSGTIDNDLTSAAATGTLPTTQEMKDQMNVMKKTMRQYKDDVGRPFNANAIKDLRLIVPPDYELPALEMLNATIIANTTNVMVNMAQLDVLDYLTSDSRQYLSALGSVRKPFIHQQREPLEIIIDTDPTNVAERDGVLVLCRERWVMTYGDPRRCCLQTWT